MTVPTERNPHWQILGAGSQGLLWAASLQQAGTPTTLLQRAGAAPFDQVLYERNGECSTIPAQTRAIGAPGPLDRLLVTVKATELVTALRDCLRTGQRPTLVVLLQNGIGAELIAREQLPPDTVIWLGTSTHGSFRRSPHHVVHAGAGVIWLGPGRGELPAAMHDALLASLTASQLDVQWDPAIQTRLWHKLAVNSCINPLTALLNCRNGELLLLPLARHWLPLLATEAAAVVSAEGHPLSAADLLARVEQIANATAGNYNSMQQDYQQHRPTEIAFITGSLLRAAATHGLQLPHHAELLTRVQQRQAFGV